MVNDKPQTSFLFAYQAIPDFTPFDRMAAGFTAPLFSGTVGVGVYRFGKELYQEHLVSVAFANQFGLAALGAKLNYIQYSVEGLGTKGVISAVLGGQADLTTQLRVGAQVINIFQPYISKDTQERLPVFMRVGIQYKSSPYLLISELEDNLDQKPTWKNALEYTLKKKFSFRTGYQLFPAAGSFGIGFRSSKFFFDYAVSLHSELGISMQASVAISPGKR